MTSIRYVMFLRGINVGGHTQVKMETLRKMLEKMGFTNVRTILNSGNALFDASENDQHVLKERIEKKFTEIFGFTSAIMLRTFQEIEELLAADPFKKITVTPQTRLYVTFLSEKAKSTLQIPYASDEKDFQILRVTDSEVCSVLVLSPRRETVDLMSFIEKEFGKKVTTRNWNSLLRIAK